MMLTTLVMNIKLALVSHRSQGSSRRDSRAIQRAASTILATTSGRNPVFDVLFENVTLPMKGKPVTLPSIVWMLKSMRNNAIKGCHRSFKTLIDANGDRGLKGLWYALKEKNRERTQEEIKEFLEWLDADMPINGIKKSAS
jgi:hypothetical protein